jgi:2-polyprenyl-6-hydroxyphenyl methylase/3-demethylubiquinone-9 3-methyltransferase
MSGPSPAGGYYAESLSAERLRRCYQIAPPRVERYLGEEIRFVLERISPTDRVLELGCGYGRVAQPLARAARLVVGIDTALASLRLARALVPPELPLRFAAMDAARLGFPDRTFDVVACVQNGICAFHLDPAALLREAMRVARRPGRVLISTYAAAFWPERLEWFRLQAAEGLVGPIDEEKTRPGLIVCRDGFSAGPFEPEAFRALCAGLGVEPRLTEVDGSSLFCELKVQAAGAISKWRCTAPP